MRDILITLLVFGAVPWILRRPHIGILVWSWLAYMNPHRMAWGFAYNLPFSAVTAGALFAGLILSDEKEKFPVLPITIVWMIFVLWMVVTTFFSLNPDAAFGGLERALKIQLVALLTLMLMAKRERIDLLIWVIVLSIGFFGVKGGLFTIVTAGQHRVWGPPETFIEGNNELALALIMIIPLMRYLHMQSTNKWVMRGLVGSMILCALSILASYSRGALLTGTVMLFFFWAKSRQRLGTALVIGFLIIAVVPFIPDQWTSRMETIKRYDEDASAIGRINAWHFAVNLAADRPITGGGFNTFTDSLFVIYAPDPYDVHDAHSIYFQILGEQGYVGLVLFLLLWAMSFGVARKIAKATFRKKNLLWAMDLSTMLQVSMIGYLTGGAFLGLAYFDLPYHLMALLILTHVVVKHELEESAPTSV